LANLLEIRFDRRRSQPALVRDSYHRRVPGHGRLCGQRGIATVREIFDDIAEQAGKMFKAGVPAEEAQHRYVVPEKFKNFFVFSWGFTIGPAITQLYAEWREKK
jgi:hypothetical protein